MNNHNETSLISNTEDSLWKYVSCEKCDKKIENELDLKKHIESIYYMYTQKPLSVKNVNHTTCETHLCEHTNDFHPKNLYGKRIRQNLKPSDLEDDSEDETEEVETNQRKILRTGKKVIEQTRKKSKVYYVCDKCQNSFSRKERNYCKINF